MEVGLYGNTHGQSYRDDVNMFLHHTPVEQIDPIQVAVTAERAGIHSIWYPDHVCMPYDSESFHTANVSGQRAYQRRHNMLDAAVVMGAVAVQTTTLKLGTSVLIAPYRHPLSDARQFMTVDQLSNGRLMLGVGVGWMVEEFDAVGIDFEERNRRTEECIQIYKASWTGDLATFEGNYYSFRNVSQDPKPAQQSPHPPIVFGGNTIRGARRAARFCDGLYPLFLDTYTEAGRYAPLQDEVRRELEAQGRSPSDFLMQCACVGADHRRRRPGRAGEPAPHLHRHRRADRRGPRAVRGRRLLHGGVHAGMPVGRAFRAARSDRALRRRGDPRSQEAQAGGRVEARYLTVGHRAAKRAGARDRAPRRMARSVARRRAHKHAIERSERPATEGYEGVAERTGVRRGRWLSRAPAVRVGCKGACAGAASPRPKACRGLRAGRCRPPCPAAPLPAPIAPRTSA